MSTKRKILVCTPSNAAVDEIVLRLSSEMSDSFGKADVFKKKMLRIGAMDYEPLEQVKTSTLDWKLEKKILEHINRNDDPSDFGTS